MVDVTINGRFLSRPPTGVERFAIELLRAWLPERRGGTARIALPGGMDAGDEHGFGVPFERNSALQGHAWEQLQLPNLCGDSVLMSLCNTSPVVRHRQLVVVHDAGVAANPSTYSFAYRRWHRCLCALLMRRAAVVATVSKFSADELSRHVGGRAGAVEVIYAGCEHIVRSPADPQILERLGLQGMRYVLAVGSRAANKNLAVLTRAAALLPDLALQFVAAGGSNRRVFAAAAIAGEQMRPVGYVADSELRALYEHALCFVFPSLYEGFGLPPLEAMHCGCPVIVSRRASLPEVCGEAALYCDPVDPHDVARQIRRIAGSSMLRSELQAAGYARARVFSWQQTAARLSDLLEHNFGAAA